MGSPNNSNYFIEDSNNPCIYIRSKARVFFVRHGKSIEDAGGKDSTPQSNGAILKHVGKRQMQAVGKYLKIAGVRGKDGPIMYGDDTQRVIESVQIIIDQLIQGDEIIKDPTEKLRTTEKGITGEQRIIENGKLFVDTVELMKEVRYQVNGYSSNNTAFILVGHKSNKSGLIQAADNTNESIDISFDIENGEIIERDIDADTGKYIDPKKHPETLSLNRSNYKAILKTLENIPGLKSAIQSFRNNTKAESEKYPIWKLQNQVNEFFSKNPTLFSTYLTHSNSPHSLRTFCLANLIRLQNYDTIEKYYLAECKELSREEKTLILQNTQDSNIKSILLKLFVSRKELWKDEENELFSKEGQSNFYDLLKGARFTYDEALGLQGNSLDPLIQKGVIGSILPRGVYIEKKEKEKDQGGNETGEESIIRHPFRMQDFLEQDISQIAIFSANVGEGKTLHLTETTKSLLLAGDYQICFLQAKNFDKENTKLKQFEGLSEFILCIDAFDEADEETKASIVSYITSPLFKGKCLMTARKGSTFAINNALIVNFNPVDTTVYFQNRFKQNPGLAKAIDSWLTGHSLEHEIRGNPLLLNLISILGDPIVNLESIKTKSDLYEKVALYILNDHSKLSKRHVCTKRELDLYIKELSKFAYMIFTETYRKTSEEDSEFYSAHLSLLKGNQKDGFEFIHRSFYEFFLAKYLANMPNEEGNQKIYDFRDEKKLGNWNDWREFRPVVLFYGEELAKNGKWEELKQFLGEDGLMKGDDMFGEGFFMGLEVLYKLPEDTREIELVKGILKGYETKMEDWDIYDILKKYEQIKKFIRNIGYIDTDISQYIISILKLNNKNIYGRDIFEISQLIGAMGTPGAIQEAARGAESMIDKGLFWGIGEIFEIIAKVGTSQAIKIAEEGAKTLISTPEGVHGIKGIYYVLAKVGTSQAIDVAKRGIEILREKEGFGWDIKRIKEAIDNKNNYSQSINQDLQELGYFDQLRKGKGPVYSMIENGNLDIIKGMLRFAGRPIEDGRFKIRQKTFYWPFSNSPVYVPEDLLDN